MEDTALYFKREFPTFWLTPAWFCEYTLSVCFNRVPVRVSLLAVTMREEVLADGLACLSISEPDCESPVIPATQINLPVNPTSENFRPVHLFGGTAHSPDVILCG